MQMLSADVDDELVRLRRSVLGARPMWDLKVGEDDCAVGEASWVMRECKACWLVMATGGKLLRCDLRDMLRCMRNWSSAKEPKGLYCPLNCTTTSHVVDCCDVHVTGTQKQCIAITCKGCEAVCMP